METLKHIIIEELETLKHIIFEELETLKHIIFEDLETLKHIIIEGRQFQGGSDEKIRWRLGREIVVASRPPLNPTKE